MENMRYEYSPVIARRTIQWPNKARLAVWVIPNIEHFEFDAPAIDISGAASPIPDVSNYARRDYGNRVGVWRIMEILDRYDIKATAALNSAVCEHYPIIIQEGKKRGWEFMGHGVTNSTRLVKLSEDEERNIIKSVIQTITHTTGKQPEGWLSPGLMETFNTPDILAEQGIRYLCDWCSDDQPYRMKVKKGNLISMPYSLDINDIPAFLRFSKTTEEFYEMIKEQFDVLYEEGAASGRVMAIALHPFVIGQPHRIKCLDKALRYIKRHKDVWFATGSEIAKWYYEHHVNV